VLPAHAYAEGFFGRSYSSLDAYAFQDLRSTVDIHTLPIVAPWYRYNYVSEPGDYGQRWSVAASALNLETPVGVDSRRLSQRTQWELPYTSSSGQMYTLTMSFQTDGYSTSDNVNPSNPDGLRSENSAGRELPQVKLDWRYPWVRQAGTVEELIEPHVAVIGGPQGRNSFLIPNQDSLDFEVDDSNLYNLNPFPGVDRVDGGERVIYGTSIGAYGSQGGTTNAFLGQIYRPHTDDTFTSYSGLSGNQSDYVGHVQIRPLTDVNLLYRYRLDEKDLSPRSTQLDAILGTKKYNLHTAYLSVTQEVPGAGITSVEQVSVAPTVAITDHWTASTNTVYNLAQSRFSSISATATYNDECFNMVAILQRSYAVNGPIQPSTSILVTLVYKGLGDVRLGGG
jgi:LPS-assembly protein